MFDEIKQMQIDEKEDNLIVIDSMEELEKYKVPILHTSTYWFQKNGVTKSVYFRRLDEINIAGEIIAFNIYADIIRRIVNIKAFNIYCNHVCACSIECGGIEANHIDVDYSIKADEIKCSYLVKALEIICRNANCREISYYNYFIAWEKCICNYIYSRAKNSHRSIFGNIDIISITPQKRYNIQDIKSGKS